jgi:hypothetical protein
MKSLVFVLLFLTLAAASFAASDPYIINPGQGFGQFRASLGIAGLEKLVKPEEYGEGESDGLPSAELYMMMPEKRVAVLMDSKKKVTVMAIHGLKSVWHTKEGITLGTPLSTLEKLNGQAFHFRSFEGEHSGEVVDWGQGALAKSLPKVAVIFASPMHAGGYAKLSESEKLEIEKPHIYASSDPVARKLNPVIETIELRF